MTGLDLTDRILADLAAHPGATAGSIAGRLEANRYIVFNLLAAAERQHRVRKYRVPPKNTWRWEKLPEPAPVP